MGKEQGECAPIRSPASYCLLPAACRPVNVARAVGRTQRQLSSALTLVLRRQTAAQAQQELLRLGPLASQTEDALIMAGGKLQVRPQSVLL